MYSIIQRRIYLDPKYLDQNIMNHIMNKIIEETSNECTKENGHILSVTRIVEILSNEDTIFTVSFEAETLKPTEGSRFTGVVCMIYKDGIFVNIANKQKMLIPAITLKGYTFNDTSKEYFNNNLIIKEGDEIQVIITAVRYNKQNFSCVGSLV